MKQQFKCELPIIAPNAARYGEWDGKTWQQLEGWRAEFENARVYWSLHIKAGFYTDGGSIPKRLQGHWSPLGFYFAAYLVHDALYAAQLVSRAEADRILCELLADLGAGWLDRTLQWAAVRVAGWLAWRSHEPENVAVARKLIAWSHDVME